MAIRDDTFDRSTSGSIGTASGGWSWTAATANFECDGSRAQAVSGNSPIAFCAALDSADHSLAVDLVIQGSTWAYLFIRSDTTAANCYKFGFISGVLRIWRTVSGGDTMIANRYDGPTTGTAKIVFRVRGTDSSEVIQLYVDGVLMHEVLADGGVDSGTRCGMGADWGGSAGATHEFDNFHARDLAAQSAFPSTGLKGQWRLNEAGGANNALDDSGNSHDLTQTSSPGSTTGIESTARTFDGAADYFSVADHADLSPTTYLTFAAWTYRSSGTNLCIASKWNYDVGADGWALQEDRVYVGTSTEFSFTRPSTGAWHHFALVVDTTLGTDALKVAVYIDGVLQVKSGSPTVALNDNADDFALGTFPGLGRLWNGYMDLAQLFNAALTQDEVLDLYNAGAGLAYSSGGGGGGSVSKMLCLLGVG